MDKDARIAQLEQMLAKFDDIVKRQQKQIKFNEDVHNAIIENLKLLHSNELYELQQELEQAKATIHGFKVAKHIWANYPAHVEQPSGLDPLPMHHKRTISYDDPDGV